MVKICNNCSAESPDIATVCYNCGKNNFSNNQNTQTDNNKPVQTTNVEKTYPTQQTTYPIEQPKNNKKTIIALVAVLVAIGLVATAFFVLYTDTNSTEKTDEFFANAEKVSGAPSMSLESLASGNLQTLPDEGYGAKYYMYYNGEKIGETKQKNDGIESYNGIDCQKIIGTTDVELSIMGSEMAFTMEYAYYIDNDNYPVHMDMGYKYTKPEQLAGMDLDSDMDWDKNSGEVTMSIAGMTYTYTLPTEYWGLLSPETLNIGYAKSFNYTMDMAGQNADISTTITVEKQEDVTVPAGTFKDCYLVNIEQTQSSATSTYDLGSTTSNMKFWITETGEVPKIETASGVATGLDSFSMTQELEGYYKIN